ncbi:YceI family protein [Ideonella paludis]|uniref:Polyisoprenoid-binding protein n=1 Tax=Ideonella paludis TaxID=1233411 RepID=A0ABS5E1Y2_9BURK|nr:YceI family protein [Ideonella paludis]MBQ0937425.1 polyisoprenoid-binding protein [Ideonella paludis]
MTLQPGPTALHRSRAWFGCVAVLVATASDAVDAAPVTYEIDARRSQPSFEVMHKGAPRWKGQFQFARGTMTIDREAQWGRVALDIDMSSVDFGGSVMNNFVKGPLMFEAQRFPMARFEGQLSEAVDGMPTQVEGLLTLHGVTKPLKLKLHQVRCAPEEGSRRERCVANASGQFLRDEFGVDFGRALGLEMAVTLKIHAEALATQP